MHIVSHAAIFFFLTKEIAKIQKTHFFSFSAHKAACEKNRSPPRRTIGIHLALRRLNRRQSDIIYQETDSSRAKVFRGKHLWNTPIPRNPSDGLGTSAARFEFAQDRGLPPVNGSRRNVTEVHGYV